MFDSTQVIANLDAALHREADTIRTAELRKDSASVDKAKARIDRLLDTRLTLCTRPVLVSG